VETDGYKYHHGREAFEADRNRDLKLKALGYEVIRLSHRQMVDEPQSVADVLARVLCLHRPEISARPERDQRP
jgi:very-short-patch-repair endonuclease